MHCNCWGKEEMRLQEFSYVIKDEMGIHARPAGILAKEAKNYASTITMAYGDKKADVTRIMAVMALGVKCGFEVTVTVEGEDEEKAAEGMKQFFEENL